MSYTDADLSALVHADSETPNLDFKETIVWDSSHNGERLEIVKDILAMANTRDGGKIVIGVSDKTRQIVGLTEEAYNSIKITKVNEFLHKFSDPVFTCNIIKVPAFEGKRVVIIDIPEFLEDPIVCKEIGQDAKNRTVLVKGGIYIRTAKCSSEQVSTADQLRGILERGINKKKR